MSFVTTEQMLQAADRGGYAVGAFNVENMEMVMAVIKAAEEMKAPAILQTTPSTIKYAGLPLYYANVKAAAKSAKVPIALHLDHGNSFSLAMQALRVGYTSIMIDGSHEEFADNILITRSVAEACAPSGIPVEAELGKVGGNEDDLESVPSRSQSVRRTAFIKESRSWMWRDFPRFGKESAFRSCFTARRAFRTMRSGIVFTGASAK